MIITHNVQFDRKKEGTLKCNVYQNLRIFEAESIEMLRIFEPPRIFFILIKRKAFKTEISSSRKLGPPFRCFLKKKITRT